MYDLAVVEAEPFGPGRSRHNESMRIRRAPRPTVNPTFHSVIWTLRFRSSNRRKRSAGDEWARTPRSAVALTVMTAFRAPPEHVIGLTEGGIC